MDIPELKFEPLGLEIKEEQPDDYPESPAAMFVISEIKKEHDEEMQIKKELLDGAEIKLEEPQTIEEGSQFVEEAFDINVEPVHSAPPSKQIVLSVGCLACQKWMDSIYVKFIDHFTKTHLPQQNQQNGHICIYCGLRYVQALTLVAHMNSCNEFLASYSTERRASMMHGILKEKSSRIFLARQCSVCFDFRSTFRSFHPHSKVTGVSSVFAKDRLRTMHACGFCTEWSKFCCYYLTHCKRTHHLGGKTCTFRCMDCRYWYKQYLKFKRHCEAEHSDNSVNPLGCFFCLRELGSVKQLRNHLLVHSKFVELPKDQAQRARTPAPWEKKPETKVLSVNIDGNDILVSVNCE